MGKAKGQSPNLGKIGGLSPNLGSPKFGDWPSVLPTVRKRDVPRKNATKQR